MLTSSLLRTLSKASPCARQTVAKALFSSDCAPALKLKSVFEDYRQKHFSRELPSRFRKEIVKVLEGPDHQVTIDSFNVVLGNIGRADAYLSEAELNDLLVEAGASGRQIRSEQAMMLI